MGFLTDGNTMGFEATKASTFCEEIVEKTRVAVDARTVVKRDGLKQLVNILKNASDKPHSILLWGDEVEMTCVDIPKCMNQPPKLWMGAYDLVSKLQELEKRTDEEWKTISDTIDNPQHKHLEYFSIGSAWHPEMSRHMIEALPDPPFAFSGSLDGCILGIEESMNTRRRKVQALVPDNVVATTITAFPAMGGFEPGHSQNWICPATKDEPVSAPGRYKGSPSSCSRLIPDDIANPHPRFPTLVENIRKRRGGSYKILVPVYQDVNTASHPMWNLSLPESALSNRKLVEHAAMVTPNPIKNQIYMDSFAFGMGTSCLQVTVGTKTIHDARHLYDQYVVLAPLVLALTASTPAYRGLLANTDTRWSALEQGCDCRTADEENPNSPNHIPKSRYSGVSLYISEESPLQRNEAYFNDSYAPINKEAYNYLIDEGLDESLAKHFAHLWIRQPMVIYDNSIFIDNLTRNDHFENLNSTNWNSVRFKPPPPGDDTMPFRVELRTAEVQLTDFENAAVASFSAVFARACMEEKWELYIPITKNDENMRTSWAMDAVIHRRFWFRTDITAGSTQRILDEGSELCTLMTMHEIMSGKRCVGWPGLVSMVLAYAHNEFVEGNMTSEAHNKFSVFCEFLKARASGEVPTCARYLRNVMTSHLHYNRDSVITPSMASRAMTAAALLGAGVFLNDVSSVKPHLGRFVLDVKPLYRSDCGRHACCVLTTLRKQVSMYEGVNGGRTPTKKIDDDVSVDTPSFSGSTTADDSTRADESIASGNRPERCRLEVMINDDNHSTITEWNDRQCSIHAFAQGEFTPTSPQGGWKNGIYDDEWSHTHPNPKFDDHICHHILKRMIEHGADLCCLSTTGFPCAGVRRSSESSIGDAQCVMSGCVSPCGPFVSTMEAKEKRWHEYQNQLENPEQTPEYLIRRRAAETRLKML